MNGISNKNMSIYGKSKSECCGCTACESICPKDAISMTPDALGFLYPQVDADKCINCGLCSRVCDFHEGYNTSMNLAEPEAYAGRLLSADGLKASQSGGAFVALTDVILQQGGIVYGAGFEGHFRVTHQRANTTEKRDALRKSKYVQSDMRGVMKSIKQDLTQGHKVLFSGTACQCAGVRAYIGKKLSVNLILVDIICHGVPAPYVWRDYLSWIEKKYKGQITEAIFRNKPLFGWRNHRESFKIGNRWIHKDAYTYLFYNHFMLRESCYACPYTNPRHPSDITLADMWGLDESFHPMLADNKGCSCILINTAKGKVLFEESASTMVVCNLKTEQFTQPNLQKPSWRNLQRSAFEQDFTNYGFERVLRKYGNVTWKRKLRLWLQRSGILPLAHRVAGKIRHEWKKLLRRQV